MEINQLISVLRKPEHRYEGDTLPNEPMRYGQDIVLELTPEQNKIYTAILKTIPRETLVKMAAQLKLEPDCAISLVDKIEWMSQEHPPKCKLKNEPIGRLLRYYLDKKKQTGGICQNGTSKSLLIPELSRAKQDSDCLSQRL